MKYVSQLRQGFNEKVRDYSNRLHNGLGDILTTPIDKKGLGALALGASLGLTGCADKEPKYGDHITIEGTVIEMEYGGGGKKLLVRSGNQLYHVGTTRASRWANVGDGDRVRVSGQHGGGCEEAFIFDDTFGDMWKGEYQGSIRAPKKVGGVVVDRGNLSSRDVIDLIHADLEVTWSRAQANQNQQHAQNRSTFGPFTYNDHVSDSVSSGYRKGTIVNRGWEYVLQRGDNPEDVAKKFNKLDEKLGNLRHEMSRYDTYVMRNKELIHLFSDPEVAKSLRVGEKIFLLDESRWE